MRELLEKIWSRRSEVDQVEIAFWIPTGRAVRGEWGGVPWWLTLGVWVVGATVVLLR